MYFFDLDGTLLDSTGVWMDIDVAFLGQYGISPVPPDYTHYVSHHSPADAAQYTKERYNIPLSHEEIMKSWEDMAYTAYSSTLPLKPGAEAFLQGCRAAGIPMAILTSCFPHLCRAALEHHNLTELFDFVLTTTETGLDKGDGALYRMACEKAGLSPDSCTLFEDNPGYCAAAKQVGLHIVGIQDPMFAHRQDELRQLCGPERYLTRFTHLSPTQFLPTSPSSPTA